MYVGDVYLTVVPLDMELKATKGMDFTQFCQLLICISLVAYRDYTHITPINKVCTFMLTYVMHIVCDTIYILLSYSIYSMFIGKSSVTLLLEDTEW